jgi:hypothetical protein
MMTARLPMVILCDRSLRGKGYVNFGLCEI